MKNKLSDINNNFNKTIGEDKERISVSDLSIKDDGEFSLVSKYKSDKEVKSVSWGSENVSVGWLKSN